MPRRPIPLVAGTHYHIFNRGNNRQAIFFERENYLFFLDRMREYLVEMIPGPQGSDARQITATTIVSYCLMPNHFHLLVCPNDGELSNRMQRLSISYTKAINKRYRRVGTLFQGPFQAIPVQTEEYLLHLSRYQHLNPVFAGLVQRAEDWEFSSYRDYLGLRQGNLVQPEVVLSQFPSRRAYQEFTEAYRPVDGKKIAHLLVD